MSSLLVVVLWVQGGGIQALFSGAASAFTTLGRVTGLVASNLLLYQVILIARVPLLERAFGHDAIIRGHRLTGFWSFWLMLAHVVLLIIGYAGTAQVDWWSQLWDFVLNYPAMLMAAVGTLLIIGVVVCSMRAIRLKMRYESWHLLHLYAYLGVAFALPHQLWTGADFLSSPLATAYWWVLWAIAAGCVLGFRVIRPLWQSAVHRVRVHSVHREGRRGVTVVMTGHRLDRLHASAGQFFVWRFLDGPGWTRGHPFSLSSRPTRERMSITARVVGDGTARLARLRPGTRVLFEGPYGNLVGDARQGVKLLMLGAGAGVAPLVSLLQEQRYGRGDATLVTRDGADDDALLSDSILELRRVRGVRHVALNGPRTRTGSPWLSQRYERWRGPQLLRSLAPTSSSTTSMCVAPCLG